MSFDAENQANCVCPRRIGNFFCRTNNIQKAFVAVVFFDTCGRICFVAFGDDAAFGQVGIYNFAKVFVGCFFSSFVRIDR